MAWIASKRPKDLHSNEEEWIRWLLFFHCVVSNVFFFILLMLECNIYATIYVNKCMRFVNAHAWQSLYAIHKLRLDQISNLHFAVVRQANRNLDAKMEKKTNLDWVQTRPKQCGRLRPIAFLSVEAFVHYRRSNHYTVEYDTVIRSKFINTSEFSNSIASNFEQSLQLQMDAWGYWCLSSPVSTYFMPLIQWSNCLRTTTTHNTETNNNLH